jgi:phosphatidylglycerol:prolipoprotein diacylglycerol transferase
LSELITFPGLGLVFEVNRVALSLGPFTVYWYGVMITTGIVLGALYAFGRSDAFGIDRDRGLDAVMYSILGGFVGARIYYVAFTWDYYSQYPEKIIRIWEGGIAIYGGIIGAFITAWFLCRRWNIRFLALGDMTVGGLLIGQALGRWGNFFNYEAFGANTNLPWGMTSSSISQYLQLYSAQLAALGTVVDPSQPVHPAFFYESLWCLIGFVVIAMVSHRRRFDGELVLLYAIWYGTGRFFFEGLRTDSLLLGSLRVSQWLSALVVVAAVALLAGMRRRIQDSGDPEYLIPYGRTAQWQRQKASAHTTPKA